MANSAEIERNIEHTRSRARQTISDLAQKMEPSEMIDEALDRFGLKPQRRWVDEIACSVSRNPAPAMMVAIGVGWIFYDIMRRAAKEHAARLEPALQITDGRLTRSAPGDVTTTSAPPVRVVP